MITQTASFSYRVAPPGFITAWHAPAILFAQASVTPPPVGVVGLSIQNFVNDAQLVRYAGQIFDVGASLTYAASVEMVAASFTLNTPLGGQVLGPVTLTPSTATGTTIGGTIQLNTLVMPAGLYQGLPLPAGVYEGLFLFTRSTGEIDPATVEILLMPYAPAACTYDLTTVVGQTRLYALDTDTSAAFFSDAELQANLNLCGQSPLWAASLALETLATHQARLATAIKIGPFASNNSVATHNAIAERAAMLRSLTPALPAVSKRHRHEDHDEFVPRRERVW